MANYYYCININCYCSVGAPQEACCMDCQRDSTSAFEGACACGHSDCEPSGLEREPETAELATV